MHIMLFHLLKLCYCFLQYFPSLWIYVFKKKKSLYCSLMGLDEELELYVCIKPSIFQGSPLVVIGDVGFVLEFTLICTFYILFILVNVLA